MRSIFILKTVEIWCQNHRNLPNINNIKIFADEIILDPKMIVLNEGQEGSIEDPGNQENNAKKTNYLKIKRIIIVFILKIWRMMKILNIQIIKKIMLRHPMS